MRIAFLIHHLRGTDGWSRYAVDLGRALRDSGHEVIALVNEKTDTPWCAEHHLLRLPLHYSNLILCFLDAFAIRKNLKVLKPDIIHIIAEPYSLLLPFLGKGTWKTCMTIHGSYALIALRNGGFGRWAAKKSYLLSDRIISVSNFTKNALKTQEPAFFAQAGLGEKIRVIHNAIKLPDQSQKLAVNAPKAIATDEEHLFRDAYPNQNASIKHLLSVGAVKARKGHLQAVEACATFKRENIPFIYSIVGSLDDTAYVQQLSERIDELGLKENVVLHGVMEEERLQQMYADADLFLLLAIQEGPYFEGFVLAFLEANAYGKPVIGSTSGGCPEAIKDGVSGFVCDPHRHEEVAKRMKEILVENKIKPTDCLQWAKEHSIEQATEKILEEYIMP